MSHLVGQRTREIKGEKSAPYPSKRGISYLYFLHVPILLKHQITNTLFRPYLEERGPDPKALCGPRRGVKSATFPEGSKIVERLSSVPSGHMPRLKSLIFTSCFIKSAHNHCQRKNIMNKQIENKESKLPELTKITFISSQEWASISNWVSMRHFIHFQSTSSLGMRPPR